MAVLASASAKAFYDTRAFPDDRIPSDAVEVTEKEHASLLDAINSGGAIEVQSGKMVAVSAPEKTVEEKLAIWRAGAAVTLTTFCEGLLDHGILPEQEVIDASNGIFPPSLEQYAEQIEDAAGKSLAKVKIAWGPGIVVRRNNPIIAVLTSQMGLTDDQADAVFGWPES